MATTDPRSTRRSHPGVVPVVSLAVAMLGVLAGCRDPLITENQLRSPFHRYDRVRNQDSDTFVRDEFGRARPNVVQRLAPR